MATIIDKPTAERIIRERFPETKRIVFVEHGYFNLIVQVDEERVFRFPRSDDVLNRWEFETKLLERLEGKLTMPIPVILGYHRDPTYALTTFLSGQQRTVAEIRQFSQADQVKLGRDLANFVLEFNQALSVEEMKKLRMETGVEETDESWDSYLERVFAQEQPDPAVQKLAEEYYPRWCAMVAQPRPEFVIHSDLHEGNLLFDGRAASGLVDFEFAKTGSIEEELRTLYRLGDTLLEAFADRFAAETGVVANLEDVRLWAATTELATYSNRLRKGETDSPSFKRVKGNLQDWLPEFPR